MLCSDDEKNGKDEASDSDFDDDYDDDSYNGTNAP